MAAVQRGAAFEFAFTRPLKAVDGERLTKPLEIEILRWVSKPGEKPSDTLARLRPWMTLSADDVRRHAEGAKVSFPVQVSSPEFAPSLGATFTLAVRGLTYGFRRHPLESELSNAVRVRLLDVSGPVESLQIKVTEKALELSWAVPTRGLSGRPVSALSGYRVYKSQTAKAAAFGLIGETAAPPFFDSDFAFDHIYFYRVRAVFKQGDSVAESDDSSTAKITPRDTFPPATPTNLSGLFAAGAVELVWTANTGADLAGYNVYRHEKDSPPQKINSQLLPTPTFEDRTVQPGHEYFYRVTAVDFAHNESPPSEEVDIETQ